MTVQNPHDRFFRESFARPEVARNYLQAKRNIARQLLALHDVVTVSELTGLSVDEVTTLQEAMRRREEDGGGDRADESE